MPEIEGALLPPTTLIENAFKELLRLPSETLMTADVIKVSTDPRPVTLVLEARYRRVAGMIARLEFMFWTLPGRKRWNSPALAGESYFAVSITTFEKLLSVPSLLIAVETK